MKRLVVVADDFGLCKSVNLGILEAYQQGIVTELSLMLGSPGTDHAVTLIKKHRLRNVGVHVLLKHWREHGDIFRRKEYVGLFDRTGETELARLFEAELREFEHVVGRPPTHITSQYGIISNPKLLPIAVRYAAQHHIPMRLPAQALYQDELTLKPSDAHMLLDNHNIITTDYFFGYVLGSRKQVQTCLITELQEVRDEQSVELMLHPGKVSKELERLSSMVSERQRDLEMATDPDFRKHLENLGFIIGPYASLQSS